MSLYVTVYIPNATMNVSKCMCKLASKRVCISTTCFLGTHKRIYHKGSM